MNLIINPSQPPGYTRPINNGSTRFALPIPGHSRLKPELEKTAALGLRKGFGFRFFACASLIFIGGVPDFV
jgi:hypothetical protein